MEKKSFFCALALIAVCGNVWAQGPNNSGIYYKNADGKKGSALKAALTTIIYPHHNVGYDGLFSAYEKTDKRTDGKVRDWYSCTTNYNFSDHGSYKKEGDCYNREHTVPQSWFGSGEIKSDVVQVVPTDGYVNNRRSNFPFGEVSSITYQSNQGYSKLGSCKTTGYNSTVFEPNDEIKGDIARIYFYMVTCYASKAAGWGHDVFSQDNLGFETWVLNMLMRWSKQDPVNEVETARNLAVYETQNNRNPFVDYPGLEDYIWGDKTDMQFSYDNYDGGGSGEVVPTVAMPVFSPDEGTYYNQVEVSISCATEGATIYYTTNGSVATEQSIPYEQPFVLTETSTVRAVAVKEGVTSYQAMASYRITDSDPGDETPEEGTVLFCDDFFNTSFGGPIASSHTEDLTGSLNGVNVTYSLGGGSNRYCNSEQIRLYPGNSLTISVTQGMISELEFVVVSESPSNDLVVSGRSLTDAKWTGNAQSVKVELGTGKHIRLSGVKVKLAGSTGIDNVDSSSLSGKRVVYNLQGQRVANPTKGMYIVDGKKVIIE